MPMPTQEADAERDWRENAELAEGRLVDFYQQPCSH